MSLSGLLGLLGTHPKFQLLIDGIRSSSAVQRVDSPEAARPYLLAGLSHHLDIPLLVILPRPEDARRLYDQLLSYLGDAEHVHLVPEPEVLPFERLVADAATTNQRLLVMAALQQWKGKDRTGRPPVVVASASAAMRKTLPSVTFEKAWHTLQVGQAVRLSDLFPRWVDLGYQREEAVEVPGTFSHRGDIVDIYPPSPPLPLRIEFFGDEIENIRLFNPISQRSIRSVDQASISPANEVLPSLADKDMVSDLIGEMTFSRCTPSARERFEEELAAIFSGLWVDELPLYNGLLNHGCFIDYLPEDGLLILDREGEIESSALQLAERAEGLRASKEDRGELPANFPSSQLSWTEFRSELDKRPRLLLGNWADGEEQFDFQPSHSYFGRLNNLANDVSEMLRDERRVVIVSRHAKRMSEILGESGVGATVLPELSAEPAPGSLSLLAGSVREGWSLPLGDGRLTLLTDAELFGTVKERRSRPKTPVKRQTFLSELVPGGYVVHVDHGIARFAGNTQMESGGEDKEYLVLEYAESDKIYVPTEHLDRVSLYLAPNDQPPSLTRLGTAEWSRVKERVKDSTRELAKELLELYASRRVVQGHSSSVDSPWQRELEDSFPYEETEDQERTIDEVKKDMEQIQPMDRLVCGDVGYGKTEVALRASFKIVNDGMQAALLVPTTVLAQQHYSTFSERLSPFPVSVEVLSRFRTKKEQQEVIEKLRLGTVDIVIGTHRLLQKDVKFKNLGLVVVDEEQRFGVAHKERLKRMRREVDILTLSATPIPRTLYMGLSGIRDMSTMETPPEERLPVKTYLSEYSDDVVKEAILRELERGGQVFFLHNRVNTIRRVADDLRRLVPQANIGIGHGRMPEGELEDVMIAFAEGSINVLVCTTIIESGLDIPNANTLIIDRADRFGLSQLYQLRGRVGRASHRAYTYLLIPRGRRITETAGKRLKVVLEATELGAGFRIAMRDLEIRGAGNVLGPEQSGQVHAVGFELYTQLLNEAVAEVKAGQGEANVSVDLPDSASPARVNLPLSAHVPESYISHLPTRLAIYQRLTKVQDRQEVKDICEELRDRFGPVPEVAENLLYIVDMKARAKEAGLESVIQSGSTITLTLVESVGGAKLALEKALGPLVKVGNQQIHVNLRRTNDRWKDDLVGIVERLMAFKEQLQTAMVPG